MALKAGDTVYSVGSIVVDSDGACRVLIETFIVGKNGERVRGERLSVEPSAELATQAAALRSAIVAAIQAAPPTELSDAVFSPSESKDQRQAARQAERTKRAVEVERAVQTERAQARGGALVNGSAVLGQKPGGSPSRPGRG